MHRHWQQADMCVVHSRSHSRAQHCGMHTQDESQQKMDGTEGPPLKKKHIYLQEKLNIINKHDAGLFIEINKHDIFIHSIRRQFRLKSFGSISVINMY